MKKHMALLRQVITIIMILCMLVSLISCSQNDTYRTTDVNEYLQLKGHIDNEGKDIKSGLFIFPKSIECPDNTEYKYFCEKGMLDNSYMIYLKHKYDQTSFSAEIDRLKNITCSTEIKGIEKNVNAIQYSTEHFNYPAYIAIYNTNMSFEYALIDEAENTVIYIFLKLCEGSEFLPNEYLPNEFIDKSMMEYDTNWENTNIYYVPTESGDHMYYLD